MRFAGSCRNLETGNVSYFIHNYVKYARLGPEEEYRVLYL